MKKIVSILVAAVLVLSLAATAFAARGISADEEALLTKFKAAVDEYAEYSPAHAAQFKNEAANALMKVDLDAAACADLAASIDKVSAAIKEVYDSVADAGVAATSKDAKRDCAPASAAKVDRVQLKVAAIKNAPRILAMVNDLVNKYGMNVSLSETLYASVSFTTVSVSADGTATTSTDKVSNGGAKIVKQTGVDMTATYAVAAVLVVALVFGFAVVTKKNLLSNN